MNQAELAICRQCGATLYDDASAVVSGAHGMVDTGVGPDDGPQDSHSSDEHGPQSR